MRIFPLKVIIFIRVVLLSMRVCRKSECLKIDVLLRLGEGAVQEGSGKVRDGGGGDFGVGEKERPRVLQLIQSQ